MTDSPADTSAEIDFVQKLTGCEDVTTIATGWTCRVYLTGGGENVVKFPRTATARTDLTDEIHALTLLTQLHNAPVQVPSMHRHHQNLDWVWLRGIRGWSLDATAPMAINEPQIATDLGTFVAQLHQLPPAELPQKGSTYLTKVIHRAQNALPTCPDALTTTTLTACLDFLRHTAPDLVATYDDDLVVSHGDLGPWNIVATPGEKCGVIDFGDFGLWDRAQDFTGIPLRALPQAIESYWTTLPTTARTFDRTELVAKVTLRKTLLAMALLPDFVNRDIPRLCDLAQTTIHCGLSQFGS